MAGTVRAGIWRSSIGEGRGYIRRQTPDASPQLSIASGTGYASSMKRHLFVIALALLVQPVAAQGWKPDKPVEIIVTCQPGCGPDGTARLIQKIWQEHRIVTVPSVVVN